MVKLNSYSNELALLARTFYSSLLVLYGISKWRHSRAIAYMDRQNLPAPALFAALAVLFELGGGLLMLFGYQTRSVGLGARNLRADRTYALG